MSHKTVSFRYESIGNLCRLLVDIMIEKSNDTREITVYHERFRNESDEIYEKFLTELYPDGCTIGENEINALVEHIRHFMQYDEKSQDLFIAYDMRHMTSYVYFKIDKKLIFASLGDHAKIISDICCDYFKDTEHFDGAQIRKFILDNFIIKSDFSNLTTIADGIANDCNYLIREMLYP